MSPKQVSASERGIGVAVITRTSAASPLALSARRWRDPEAMLLVDDGETKIREGEDRR